MGLLVSLTCLPEAANSFDLAPQMYPPQLIFLLMLPDLSNPPAFPPLPLCCLSVHLWSRFGALQACCGIMPACIMDPLTNYIEYPLCFPSHSAVKWSHWSILPHSLFSSPLSPSIYPSAHPAIHRFFSCHTSLPPHLHASHHAICFTPIKAAEAISLWVTSRKTSVSH